MHQINSDQRHYRGSSLKKFHLPQHLLHHLNIIITKIGSTNAFQPYKYNIQQVQRHRKCSNSCIRISILENLLKLSSEQPKVNTFWTGTKSKQQGNGQTQMSSAMQDPKRISKHKQTFALTITTAFVWTLYLAQDLKRILKHKQAFASTIPTAFVWTLSLPILHACQLCLCMRACVCDLYFLPNMNHIQICIRRKPVHVSTSDSTTNASRNTVEFTTLENNQHISFLQLSDHINSNLSFLKQN